MYHSHEEIPIREALLERIKHSNQKAIGRQLLYDMKLERYQSIMFDEMVYRLSTDVWAEKLVDDYIPVEVSGSVTVKRPSTWWQHFKQSHFPAWALTRWPVVYAEEDVCLTARRRVHVRQYLKYPGNDHVLAPNLGRAVICEMADVVE